MAIVSSLTLRSCLNSKIFPAIRIGINIKHRMGTINETKSYVGFSLSELSTMPLSMSTTPPNVTISMPTSKHAIRIPKNMHENRMVNSGAMFCVSATTTNGKCFKAVYRNSMLSIPYATRCPKCTQSALEGIESNM